MARSLSGTDESESAGSFGRNKLIMQTIRRHFMHVNQQAIGKNSENNTIGKINIEIRRSTTPGKRVILVQGPC